MQTKKVSIPKNTQSGNEIFYCRGRRRKITYDKCLRDFVSSNLFRESKDSNRKVNEKDRERLRALQLRAKKSACWSCLQGRLIRTEFANRGYDILQRMELKDIFELLESAK